MVFQVKLLKPHVLLPEIALKKLFIFFTKFYQKSADGVRWIISKLVLVNQFFPNTYDTEIIALDS